MRGWQLRICNYIIHAAERAFAKGAFTPSVSPETLASVPFAILPEAVKQMKKEMEN
jgi:hypothetical protein